MIIHQYDALGNKYFTTYYTRNTPIVVPIGNIVEQLDSAYNVLTYSYDDNFVYKINANNIIKREFVHNPEGYIRYGNDGVNFYPYYYIKDYLGNVRETYVCLTQTSSQCIQRMQYYPSGMPWNDNYQASQQPYKYGSKEFVEMHGLDEYDSEARWYYPALMRTTTQDPLAEKYYDISPYAWCANNPVNLVDPDGRRIKIVDGEEEEEYVLNSQYTGKNEYIDLMYSALNKIYLIEMGKTVLDPLISSDDVYTILNKKSSKEKTKSYTATTKTMNISIDNTLSSDSYNAPMYIAHESFHAYQLYKGSMIGTCHSEVEAYLYSYAVFDRLGKVAPNMLLPKFEDATYNNAVSNILLKSFNKKDFDYVVLNFKNISIANANGVYNNLKQTLNNMYLLTPFYPLIP